MNQDTERGDVFELINEQVQLLSSAAILNSMEGTDMLKQMRSMISEMSELEHVSIQPMYLPEVTEAFIRYWLSSKPSEN